MERGGVSRSQALDQVSHIHRHLFYGGVVEGLDVPQGPLVVFRHHVDGHTLPAKTASSTNPAISTDDPCV